MNHTAQSGDNPESTSRSILSRLLGIVAILLLYRFPDIVALGVFVVSILVYYIPRPAAAKCEQPKWMRILVMLNLVLVFGLITFVDSPAPAGSRIRPVFAYGLLLILLLQIVWDVVRHRMLKQRSAQGAAGASDEDANISR